MTGLIFTSGLNLTSGRESLVLLCLLSPVEKLAMNIFYSARFDKSVVLYQLFYVNSGGKLLVALRLTRLKGGGFRPCSF